MKFSEPRCVEAYLSVRNSAKPLIGDMSCVWTKNGSPTPSDSDGLFAVVRFVGSPTAEARITCGVADPAVTLANQARSFETRLYLAKKLTPRSEEHTSEL